MVEFLRHLIASCLACFSRAIDEPGHAEVNHIDPLPPQAGAPPMVFNFTLNESPRSERAHPPLQRQNAIRRQNATSDLNLVSRYTTEV